MTEAERREALAAAVRRGSRPGEVARGAGIPANGIGLPGRFVVEIGRGKHARIVDPFAGGRPLSVAAALDLAIQATGDSSLTPDDAIVVATPRAIMLRVLGNLAA